MTIAFEFYYILQSAWSQSYYFMIFWTVYVSALCFFLAVVQVSLIVNYLSLCHEDYRWWWKIYFVGFSPAVYALLVSLYYLVFTMHITHFTSVLIYLIVTLIATGAIGMACGSIAVIFTFQFNKWIYSRVNKFK
mmetsp:Transcript_10366/g.14280  ORF Transcript_10366/g.14280 Transcript_10366/m.14280 type:complete len:134 (+) Transcript_10366:1499-1900(+)